MVGRHKRKLRSPGRSNVETVPPWGAYREGRFYGGGAALTGCSPPRGVVLAGNVRRGGGNRPLSPLHSVPQYPGPAQGSP